MQSATIKDALMCQGIRAAPGCAAILNHVSDLK